MTVRYLCFKLTINNYQHHQSVNYLLIHSYYHSKTGMHSMNLGTKSKATCLLSGAMFKQLPYFVLNVSKWLLTNISKYCSNLFFTQSPILRFSCGWT